MMHASVKDDVAEAREVFAVLELEQICRQHWSGCCSFQVGGVMVQESRQQTLQRRQRLLQLSRVS
jgi:hypothetical protein